MNRYICIHGHFYQPPRENPWLEEVEMQDSAYPYHDWNERITAECYAPNAASRILDSEKRIVDIVNNYAKISFNFGPTLLSWMQVHAPRTYQAIIDADRESQKRFSGHGCAIAQVYNHMIMPLAGSRDKRTQVIWGIADFEHRFERKPEGMWVPETAVDLETLDIMAEHGIKFTILAPHQAKRVKKIDEKNWKNVTGGRIDPKVPYLCRLPSGRIINIFFYDGPISHDIAFGGLLSNGEAFARRLLGAFSQEVQDRQPQLVHIATDGESYGHHHRFGDMTLAYCLYYIESNKLAEITIYGEYLEKHPPVHEVEIIENTSWSCAHGIERWRSNCGCNAGHPGWSQEWRHVLREAMDWLRESLKQIYEKEMSQFVKDPWQARNDYIQVILDRSSQNVERFFSNHAGKLSKEEKAVVLRLLEMQRHAMLMYTSCGWFFDENSGIETQQVMQYAARAIQLARNLSSVDLEPYYLRILERAASNIQEFKNGAKVYEMLVKPAIIDLLGVGVHYAVFSLFEECPQTFKIYCYTVRGDACDMSVAGKQRLATGMARLVSDITWEESAISFAVLHLGDHNVIGGVHEHGTDEDFVNINQKIKDAFMKSDVPEVISLMDKYFGTHNYSLRHLFRDEQRKILDQILRSAIEDTENSLRQIYGYYYPVMNFMNDVHVPLPGILTSIAGFIQNTDIRQLLESEDFDPGRLQKLIEEVKRWHVDLDKGTICLAAGRKINSLMEELSRSPADASLLETARITLEILGALSLKLNLWEAQNIYFSIGKQLYNDMLDRAEKGEPDSKRWVEHFNGLGYHLGVRIK